MTSFLVWQVNEDCSFVVLFVSRAEKCACDKQKRVIYIPSVASKGEQLVSVTIDDFLHCILLYLTVASDYLEIPIIRQTRLESD